MRPHESQDIFMSALMHAMTLVSMQSLARNTSSGTASRGLGATHVMSACGFLTKSDFLPVADSLGVTRSLSEYSKPNSTSRYCQSTCGF